MPTLSKSSQEYLHELATKISTFCGEPYERWTDEQKVSIEQFLTVSTSVEYQNKNANP